MAGRIGATHRGIVEHALEAAGLTERKSPQDRRVCPAANASELTSPRALAQEPAILLLDEPTNHLDLRARADLVMRVASLGITVVAVLHDLSLVSQFAVQVVVLQDGRIVSRGPPGHRAGDRHRARGVRRGSLHCRQSC